MKYSILILLFFSNSVFAADLPELDPDKFTVCAITINSDNERNVFEQEVKKNPKKFNPIVELTNFDGDWFEEACKSNIQCDQLLISGHFGGSFFGSSGKSLSLSTLEKAGCSKTCEGILSHPYEVFLMGCNTLSTKEQDHRTPAQYLQVLLEDGISPVEAEMVVEARYGAVGDDHRSGMIRAFGGKAKQIYGFYSVGPSGKNVEGFLKKYFKQSDLNKRLEKLSAKRMINDLDMVNHELALNLKSTAFAQCSAGGVGELDPKTKIICQIQDQNLNLDQRIEAVIEALNHESYLSFIPAINSFLKDHPISTFNDSQKDSIKIITKNQTIKKQVLSLLKTTGLPLASEWSNFAKNLGFISEDERLSFMNKRINQSFAGPITLANADFICSEYNSLKESPVDIDEKPLLRRVLTNYDIAALSCLKIESEKIKRTLPEKIKSKNPEDRCFGYRGIASIQPHSDEDFNYLKQSLKDDNKEAHSCGLWSFSERNIQDPNLQQEIINLLKKSDDLDYKDEVINSLNGTNPLSPLIESQLFELLNNNTIAFNGVIINLLVRSNKSKNIEKIIDLLETNHQLKWIIRDALVANGLKYELLMQKLLDKISDGDFSDGANDVIYNILNDLSPLSESALKKLLRTLKTKKMAIPLFYNLVVNQPDLVLKSGTDLVDLIKSCDPHYKSVFISFLNEKYKDQLNNREYQQFFLDELNSTMNGLLIRELGRVIKPTTKELQLRLLRMEHIEPEMLGPDFKEIQWLDDPEIKEELKNRGHSIK